MVQLVLAVALLLSSALSAVALMLSATRLVPVDVFTNFSILTGIVGSGISLLGSLALAIVAGVLLAASPRTTRTGTILVITGLLLGALGAWAGTALQGLLITTGAGLRAFYAFTWFSQALPVVAHLVTVVGAVLALVGARRAGGASVPGGNAGATPHGSVPAGSATPLRPAQ